MASRKYGVSSRVPILERNRQTLAKEKDRAGSHVAFLQRIPLIDIWPVSEATCVLHEKSKGRVWYPLGSTTKKITCEIVLESDTNCKLIYRAIVV